MKSATEQKTTPTPEYLRPGPMAAALGVSRVTLWRLAGREGFPKSVNLSSRCTLFNRAKVLAWFESQTTVEAA